MTQKKLVISCFAVMLDAVVCLPLSIICHEYNHSGNNIHDVVKHIEGKKPADQFIHSKTIPSPIAHNPCVLLEMASYFDVSSLRLIVSKQNDGLLDAIVSCRNVFSRSIERKSVVYIQGDENSITDLKKDALYFLTRDIKCYVVVCSETCSSLLLTLAVTLGFGVDIYFWITIAQPTHLPGVYYPNILTQATFIEGELDQSGKLILTTLQNVEGNGTQVYQNHHYRETVLSKRRQPLMELIKPLKGKGYAIIHPRPYAAPPQKIMLRIVTLISSTNYQKVELLDHDKMKCKRGLLCWYYPSLNGSVVDKREPSCCLGLVMEILSQLLHDLNVDFYIYEVEDRLYGAGKNGSWHGLIGEVHHGKADIAAQWLFNNEARQNVVDYTDSFAENNIVVVARSQLSPLPYLNIEALAAVSTQSWILILCLTLISAGIIYWTEKLIFMHSRAETGNHVIHIVTYAMGLLFQRDIGGLVPRNLGSRVVSVALAITLMIIMTTYTAVLTTRNIIKTRTLPINGLNDPKLTNPMTKFKLGTYWYGPNMRLLEGSPRATWRQIAKMMKPNNFTVF